MFNFFQCGNLLPFGDFRLLIINGGTYPTQAIMGVTKQPLAEGEVDAPREEHIGFERL